MDKTIIRDMQDAKEYLYRHVAMSDALQRPELFLKHTETVANTALELTDRLGHKYPSFPVDPNEMCISGYVHDIGRPIAKNDLEQEFHAIVGPEYLKEQGHERLGIITMAHSICPELVRIKGFQDYRYEDLLPIFWQQVILTYADCIVDGEGNKVDLTKRFADMGSRYTGTPTARALITGFPRIKNMENLLTNAINNIGDFGEFEFL
ncbi:MAG: HD domain-containing protein [Nanoarchaeota archaeon]